MTFLSTVTAMSATPNGSQEAARVLPRARYIPAMRSDTAQLRSGYRQWTRRVCVWFHRATPWLGLLVTLGCPSGATLSNRSASLEALPVTAITGSEPGPTVAFVAGVHGGKRSAVLAVEQLRRELPGSLRRGRVLLLAPANRAGYEAGLAQLNPVDSLNLNRVFPGNSGGRPTERLAAAILSEIVANSDYLVDLHGSDGDEAVGRFAYAARPGVNPPVDNSAFLLARAWGVPVVVRDEEGPRLLAESRFLQTAAHLSNVPAITVFEAGSTREDSAATAAFVRGARATLEYLGMVEPRVPPAAAAGAPASVVVGESLRVFARRSVVTAATAGRWEPQVAPGESLEVGELIGQFTSSTGEVTAIRATESGLVLHQRKAGDVTAGTPLIIAGTSAPRSAPSTRP
jgi:predicted deacylase